MERIRPPGSLGPAIRPDFSPHTVQHGIDVLWRFIRAEKADNFDIFVQGHPHGDVRVIFQFAHSHAQAYVIDQRQAVHRPVMQQRPDVLVQRLALLIDLGGQFAGERSPALAPADVTAQKQALDGREILRWRSEFQGVEQLHDALACEVTYSHPSGSMAKSVCRPGQAGVTRAPQGRLTAT